LPGVRIGGRRAGFRRKAFDPRQRELAPGASGYTPDTLRSRRSEIGSAAQLYLLMGADQYAADVLVRLDSDLVKTLSVIRKSLEVLEERRAAPTEG